ncbi:hypothetical protein FB45DRAFT_828419 [Roridomyces roridus]|uniref:Right handed beta helix domain-containing protein n=1 Tax=Roridomyces roridus TaxID=1738132 RepID=A0AAD7C645_9AGAR|nr:hypothetical protein FB45DRAFT_828419 [Roridomyces roridus]
MPNRHARYDISPVEFREVDFTRRDDDSDCVNPDPANTVTDRINGLLSSSGPGYVLRLCPGREYIMQSPILFAAPGQEISTLGYPTDDSRATFVVNGPVANGAGHTTAVDGTCSSCSNIVLRNVQIDGARRIAPPTSGGANIEFGGGNSNQTIQYVKSYDPRSWSCLHVAEGPFTCNGVVVQNNDIGPCGVDAFQEWADGISISCQNAIVRDNVVEGATDGGIVLFGSPGTQVYNNVIRVGNYTQLGGINMVDYLPWRGNYTNTVVHDNTIFGGFATSPTDGKDTKGTNSNDAIIKIGIAIGPSTWFGSQYGTNVSFSGAVLHNNMSGAFSYGIAMSSAVNFTVQNNVMSGNTSFIGAVGPNCSTSDVVPTPAPFVYDSTAASSTFQKDFVLIPDAKSLTCVLPPDGGDYWPFGGDPGAGASLSGSTGTSLSPLPSGQSYSSSDSSTSTSKASSTAGVVVGVLAGIAILVVMTWFLRKFMMKRIEDRELYNASKEYVVGKGPGYVKQA